MDQDQDNLPIKEFNLIEIIDNNSSRKPRGVRIYVKKSLHASITASNAFTLNDSKGGIAVATIDLNSIRVVELYAKPQNLKICEILSSNP